MNLKDYYLHVKIPHDDIYDSISAKLKRVSYVKGYYHSIVPPNIIEYKFGPLTEKGIENWKQFFRDELIETKYPNSCVFYVEYVDRDETI
jgi:hypothetical protein